MAIKRILIRVACGGVAIGLGIFLHLRLTEPNPARGRVAPVKQQIGEVTYRPLVIAAETAVEEENTGGGGGIYDPSIEYSRDGATGWLLYSAVTGHFKPIGQYVHTCLAKSMDHGKTWSFVARINNSADGTLDLGDGRTRSGAWRYEVATLVRDDGAPEGDWKLFVHKYFWNPQKDRMFAYGWIVMRTARDPSGPWSEEVALFGAVPPDPRGPELAARRSQEPGGLLGNGLSFARGRPLSQRRCDVALRSGQNRSAPIPRSRPDLGIRAHPCHPGRCKISRIQCARWLEPRRRARPLHPAGHAGFSQTDARWYRGVRVRVARTRHPQTRSVGPSGHCRLFSAPSRDPLRPRRRPKRLR